MPRHLSPLINETIAYSRTVPAAKSHLSLILPLILPLSGLETRVLERLPSLSWQEQLPPLNVPLLPIAAVARRSECDEEASQQQ